MFNAVDITEQLELLTRKSSAVVGDNAARQSMGRKCLPEFADC